MLVVIAWHHRYTKKSMSTLFRSPVLKALVFFLLPLLVFGWTSFELLATYTLQFALISLVAVIGLHFVKRESIQHLKVVLQITTVLLFVGATGWFFSPFFFVLYLIPLYLGFLYRPVVSFAFLAALLIIFSASIGEVDIAYDIMTLLSLLIVIPLVIFLRRKYLALKESSRDILILEPEQHEHDPSSLAHILHNRINELGTLLRQPVTYLKQGLSLMSDGKLTQTEGEEVVQRMRKATDDIFTLIKEFERDVTRNTFLIKEATKRQQTKKSGKIASPS